MTVQASQPSQTPCHITQVRHPLENMKSFRAEYKWTADQLLVATWMHARNSSFRKFEIGLYVVGLSSVGLGVGLWYTDFKGLCLPLIMLGLYVLFLRKPIQNWQIKRHFKRRKDQGITISFEFGEDEVKVQSAQSKGTFGWDQYPRATIGPDGVILYQPFDRYHWVPSSAFGSINEWEGFVELARSKIDEFKDSR